ncbi:hypothetical protein EVC29_096 [Rhizobium phage RHph_Y52]|nr:hypothetical protein EVC16_096 [Rhizobium phage RHph_Y21]QIG76797.1 hypothetical protein EVC29_096 [Rhizobium phage RHph_Y52]
MRFIDMSGAQKGREWAKHLARTNWRAEMSRIEKEAAAIDGSTPRGQRQLEQLRRDWRSAKNNIEFLAKKGIVQ